MNEHFLDYFHSSHLVSSHFLFYVLLNLYPSTIHVPRFPEASVKEAKSYVPVKRGKGGREGGKTMTMSYSEGKKHAHTSPTYHE